MSCEFREYRLSDIQTLDDFGFVDGPFGSNLPATSYIESGVPVIRGVNLSLGVERFKDEGYVFVSEDTAKKLKRSSCMPGDIVFTKKGTLGQAGLIPKNSSFNYFILSSNQMRLRVNKEMTDPRYVYYFVSSKPSRDRVLADAMTAGVPKINLTYLRAFRILLPELKVQKRIAAILTAYDDLIEVNKRRIALLEKMAEELYREWFVRLRFPGYQNTRFVKGRPEEWPFDAGSVFFDHVKGKSYSSHEVSDEDGACFFITLKSFHRRGGYRQEGLKYFSGSYKESQSLESGDVVMAVTDMTQDRAVVGEVARIPKLLGKKSVISLDVVRLIPKNMSSVFLYSYMRYSGFANHIKEFANGANVLHLKPDLIGNQKLLFPPSDLRDKFSALVEPLYQEIDALGDSNSVLTKTRDLLLPRLISGKLSVEDLDIQFPPSMQEEAVATPAEQDLEPEAPLA